MDRNVKSIVEGIAIRIGDMRLIHDLPAPRQRSLKDSAPRYDRKKQ